ncbi:hypothetical protein TNIN_71911 [Trichonephila inaurata madagascariensis]|uniref:Uncharacterized protein n=1 Tax=Trichonephila inaurata madagascariensis TaxID=2747483 RepID=A0A8X6WMF9_9ARAC|nr:hypothetical protein TNIN_71911 [Trichonephila inaurata madagascariensis]
MVRENRATGERPLEEKEGTTFTTIQIADKVETRRRSKQGMFDIQRRIIDNGIQKELRKGVSKDKSLSIQEPSRIH